MEKIKLEVSVPKEAYELAKGLADFLKVVIAEIKDGKGWETMDDLPAVAAATLALFPALKGVMEVPADLKEDLSGTLSALTLGLAPVTDLLTKG